jgi:hypothetical protein
MTIIELTDEQRQALQAEQGKWVEVVDPATRQRYVLVAREQYERVRPLLEGPLLSPPARPAQAAGSVPEAKPLRQRVRDLPLPPEVAAEAKRHCKRLGLWGAKERRRVEEQMKLQHYYGGKWIAILQTVEGPVVVAAADSLGNPAFDRQLAFLSPEERRQRVIECPVRLFDTESELLTPFSDEG